LRGNGWTVARIDGNGITRRARRTRRRSGAGACGLGRSGGVEPGHDGEEALGGGDDVFEFVAAKDFLAERFGVLGDGDDGDAFPRAAGRPGGDEPGEWRDGEEIVKALVEIGGEAELEAARIEFGLELEEVEDAEVAGLGVVAG
jgi:hypothetical protein